MANNSLLSFASGMIIATSIFTAVYYIQPSKEDEKAIVEEHITTDREVQQYLNNKGYISIPKQTYDELMALQAESKKPAQKEKEIEAKPKVPETAPPKKVVTEKKSYTLTVKPGMDSIQIAKLLENAGIVDSRKEFDQFLTKKNWTASIQVGAYKLDDSMTYEEIGKIITKK